MAKAVCLTNRESGYREVLLDDGAIWLWNNALKIWQPVAPRIPIELREPEHREITGKGG